MKPTNKILKKRYLSKFFVKQLDQADCGVACLMSILRYYQIEISREQLRIISGTNSQGTTMLGLLQAAQEIGLSAEGLRADSVHNLKDISSPCIFHIISSGVYQHYVVYYGSINGRHIVSDPGVGIVEMNDEELNKVWVSKSLLTLTPTKSLTQLPYKNTKLWSWLNKSLKEDFSLLVTVVSLGIIASILGVTTAIFSQKLIDSILPSNNTNKLITGITLLAIILFFRAALNYIRSMILVWQSRKFNLRTFNSFFSSLITLPKIFFDTRKIGDIISRLNDTRRIQNTVSYLAGNVITDFLSTIVTILFLFKYSIIIGFISLVSLTCYSALAFYFNNRIIFSQKGVMAAYARTESHFIDSIDGINEIKANQKEGYFSTITYKIYNEFQNKFFNLSKIANTYSLFSEITNSLLITLIIGIASYMVLHKSIKVGELIAIITLSSTTLSSVSKLILANIQIQEARVAFERMCEFEEIESEQSNSSNFLSKEITSLVIENLSFRFPGRPLILTGVSLTLKKGLITGITGENGSGKSTLIQILQQFYTGNSNSQIRVLYEDSSSTNLYSIPIAQWRKQVATVSQVTKIFNGNVLDNIGLDDCSKDAEKVISFCKDIGLHDFFLKLPQHYFTQIGEDGINISGGQKQLIGLARALYKQPKLLLLDEATAALDATTESAVLDILEKNKHKMLIVMVTHRNESKRILDVIYNL